MYFWLSLCLSLCSFRKANETLFHGSVGPGPPGRSGENKKGRFRGAPFWHAALDRLFVCSSKYQLLSSLLRAPTLAAGLLAAIDLRQRAEPTTNPRSHTFSCRCSKQPYTFAVMLRSSSLREEAIGIGHRDPVPLHICLPAGDAVCCGWLCLHFPATRVFPLWLASR